MPEEGVDNIWTAPHIVSVYSVDDPEGVVINEGKWSLTGNDAAKFQLNTGTTDNMRTLEFIAKPNFEMPGDSNEDNIYEVTVVASDGEEQATRAVTVKITNSDEAGVITLSNENPVAGKAVTATLKDSDGDVINDTWQWYAITGGSELLKCWLLMLMMLMMRPAHRPLRPSMSRPHCSPGEQRY